MKTLRLLPTPPMFPPCDLIGDVHGYTTKLERLLEKLGYRRRGGVYSQPGRRAVFVGDFIDRGPEIRATLHLVRGMVEAGNALAVMGNHEFNALTFHEPDGKGRFLRPHTPRHLEQHRATLDQLASPHPREWRDWLAWFATLPLALDLGALRVVHASWDPAAVAAFRQLPRLDRPLLEAMMESTHPLGHQKELLLNGLELDLPPGAAYFDPAGYRRKDIRTRWWEPRAGKTYRQVVLPAADSVPDVPIPAHLRQPELTYDPTLPPVFFGHYWLPADARKEPLAPNVACLDYSVARQGEMTAYRWDGETILRAEKFVTSAAEPVAANA